MMKNNKLMRFNTADFRYRYLHVVMIYIFLIAMCVISGIINENFLKPNNLRNVLMAAFPLMLVAFGQFFVILTGGIDLSVGGMIALSNVVFVSIMTRIDGVSGLLIGLIATLIVGLLMGMLNGIFITKGRLPAIIVTIASTEIFGGLALYIMEIPGGSVYKPFAKFVTGKVGEFPITLFLLIIIVVCLRLLSNKTSFGKAIRAIGGNESSAFSTGIKVWKQKFYAYVTCGLLSALAGIFMAAVMYSGDANIGKGFVLNSITSTVVGGTLMSGAVGDILGTVAGVLIVYIINNMLNLIGVSSFYQSVFQGLILIIALVISKAERK